MNRSDLYVCNKKNEKEKNRIKSYSLEHVLVVLVERPPLELLVVSFSSDCFPCQSAFVPQGAVQVIDHELHKALTLQAVTDPARGQYQRATFVYHLSCCEPYLTKSE